MRTLVAAAVAALIATPVLAETPTQGVSPTEIKIGTYTDLSGVTAMWGVNNSNAWRMVFDDVNKAGGINGRKIKYIVEDNQYQVPRSVQAENKLLNEDHVFIEVANGGTPMNNATMPMQLKAGVPNVFPLTSARSMYEPFNHLKFGLAASYYDQVRAGVKYFVSQKGKKTVCAMTEDTDFGRDVLDGATDQLKAMEMQLAALTQHKPTDTDFSAAVAKMREANCDLIVVGGIVRDTNQIISAVRKTGWNVTLMGQAASYDEAVAKMPGGTSEGFYSMAPILVMHVDDPDPKVHAFVVEYKNLYGREPNFAAQVGYTGAQLVVQALKNAGPNLTTDSFVKGMESIKDYHDIFGSPAFTFGPDKHLGSNQSFLCVVKDGEWVPVSKEPLSY
ncbi:MAG TPA: ABC transporter substrate-binding protein [Acetobacteraceae bacterium]|nr:ABC transporter substrate-binding protein [Acetobacteraceae bacterium]